MDTKFHKKIKENIINDLNQDLYKYLNLSLYETNHYFGYYNGYIYNLIDKVYERHGPSGLRSEAKYIVQYLTFYLTSLIVIQFSKITFLWLSILECTTGIILKEKLYK